VSSQNIIVVYAEHQSLHMLSDTELTYLFVMAQTHM